MLHPETQTTSPRRLSTCHAGHTHGSSGDSTLARIAGTVTSSRARVALTGTVL